MAGRRRSWGWPATVTVFAVGVALWSLRGVVPWELADQMGGVVGTALALVGFVQAWMQIRERRAGGDGSPADNLAQAVVRAPEGERKRLLGGSTAAVNITFRRRATPSTAGRPAAERGEFDDISGYYDTVHDGRLVITGGAGAGKTVLAMELIFALCTRREGDDPVPVRLPLAGWDGAGTFEEWLIGRLVDEYGLPPDTARSLVKARKVIPVLDGLDEMDPGDADAEDSRAAAALTALGDWLDGRQGAPLVLTCRSEWYDRLTEVGRPLSEATRIELERVSPEDAVAHLADPGRHLVRRRRGTR